MQRAPCQPLSDSRRARSRRCRELQVGVLHRVGEGALHGDVRALRLQRGVQDDVVVAAQRVDPDGVLLPPLPHGVVPDEDRDVLRAAEEPPRLVQVLGTVLLHARRGARLVQAVPGELPEVVLEVADVDQLGARRARPGRAGVHGQEMPVDDEQRQGVEELLHELHVLPAPRLQQRLAVEQPLLDAHLGQLGGERVVVAQEVEDVARELVDQAEDDVHDLDGGVHGEGEPAAVVVHRVPQEEEDRLVLAQLLPVVRRP